MKLEQVRKAIASALGGLAAVVATGIVPEPWNTWAVTAIMVGTVLGVYNLPNEPAEEAPEEPRHLG